MEGRMDQRVTKVSHAKSNNYTTNKFNVNQLKPLVSFGSASGTYHDKISINLAPGLCWTIITDTNPVDVFSLTNAEEVVVQVNVSEIPETGEILPAEEEQQMEEQATGDGTTDEQQTDGATGISNHRISEAA